MLSFVRWGLAAVAATFLVTGPADSIGISQGSGSTPWPDAQIEIDGFHLELTAFNGGSTTVQGVIFAEVRLVDDSIVVFEMTVDLEPDETDEATFQASQDIDEVVSLTFDD